MRSREWAATTRSTAAVEKTQSAVGNDADEVSGGEGADKTYGNAGDDNLIDAPDNDRDLLYGGSGRDNVQVRDFPAVRDVVYLLWTRARHGLRGQEGRGARLRDRAAALKPPRRAGRHSVERHIHW